MAVSVLIAVAAWEWAGLSDLNTLLQRGVFVLVVMLVSFGVGLSSAATLIFMVLSVFFWLWAFIGLRAYSQSQSPWGLQSAWSRMFLGVILLVSGLLSMVWLRVYSQLGTQGFVYVLLVVSATDSGAYVFGRWLGRHSFAPRVSPNKTWEGFCGGLVAASMVMAVGIYFFNLPRNEWLQWLGLSYVVALVSIYGDLLVSMLKRIAGVKDSGVIIPGHGGLMDRLDSVLPSILVFLLGLIAMNITVN